MFTLGCFSIALGVTAALAAGSAFFFTDPQLAVMATMMAIQRIRSAGLDTLTTVAGAYGSVLNRIRFNVATKYLPFQAVTQGSRSFAFVCFT
jgi:hypothetical protein